MKARYIVIMDFDTDGRWGNTSTEINTTIENEQYDLQETLLKFMNTSMENQKHVEYKSMSVTVRERRGNEISDLSKMKLRKS